MSTINTAVPRHARDVIRPEIIASTRTASCFGRAALVGAALLEAGTPPEALSLLISEAHGVQKHSGGYWYGHSELVVDTPDQGALVLTARNVALGELGTTNWRRGVKPEQQDVITGVSSLPGSYGGQTEQAMSYLGGILEDPAIFAARDRYRAYSFGEGVGRYQLLHPVLREGPIVAVADYAALYAALPPAGS